MQYKAVGFNPPMTRGNSVAGAAVELEALIQANASQGWEFVGLQNHSTVVPGTAGCFGFGAMSPYDMTISIAVFRQ